MACGHARTMHVPGHKGLRAQETASSYRLRFTYLFIFFPSYIFFARFPSKLSSSLFTDEQRAYPSRITTQRRHRRRHAVGTRCEDSFQIKTLRKPFLLSLVAILPWFLPITKAEPDILASAASEDHARTWTLGA